ncbi:unnamed protein product, partial [Porites lobata]
HILAAVHFNFNLHRDCTGITEIRVGIPFLMNQLQARVQIQEKEEKKNQKTPRDGPKKARYCSACKNPMKGHKNVKDCPKNKK